MAGNGDSSKNEQTGRRGMEGEGEGEPRRRSKSRRKARSFGEAGTRPVLVVYGATTRTTAALSNSCYSKYRDRERYEKEHQGR